MSNQRKLKGKTSTKITVPQSREEAERWIAQIGEQRRIVARIEHDANDQIVSIKQEAESQAQPYKNDIETMIEGLQVWAIANRETLTDGGKRQSAELATGNISWRQLPAKVTLRKIEDVIDALKKMGLHRFLRIKEEVNKDAMRDESDAARLVPGVSIGSAGESFSVEPFEVALEAAKI